MSRIQPWHTLKRRYLIRRWWMNLREDHVRLPNGTELDEFHVLEYPDWVCVLCLTEEGKVVVVEQYRHGIAQVGIELPAGAIDPNEDPLTAAQRELLEETGIEAEHWTFIGRMATEPSRHTNRAYFYFADKGRAVRTPSLDDSEDLHVRFLEPSALMEGIESGRFQHGVQLAAIFWAERRGLLTLAG